jgi:hypothetical protein
LVDLDLAVVFSLPAFLVVSFLVVLFLPEVVVFFSSFLVEDLGLAAFFASFFFSASFDSTFLSALLSSSFLFSSEIS